MKRQRIVTDWKNKVVRHFYEDKGPGRAVSRPASALENGRVVGTKHPGTHGHGGGGRVRRVP